MIQKMVCGVDVRLPDQYGKMPWRDQEIMERYWTPSPGDVCIDAGFGPGAWTLVALAMGASVFSFDPKPEACGILSQILAVNRFSRCCVVQAGLWNESKVLPFGVNSFKEGFSVNMVPVITLDDFVEGFGLGKLGFINMDVEASEREVILGAKNAIRRFKPRVLVEVHDGVDRGEIRDILGGLGGYRFEDADFYLAAIPT